MHSFPQKPFRSRTTLAPALERHIIRAFRQAYAREDGPRCDPLYRRQMLANRIAELRAMSASGAVMVSVDSTDCDGCRVIHQSLWHNMSAMRYERLCDIEYEYAEGLTYISLHPASEYNPRESMIELQSQWER